MKKFGEYLNFKVNVVPIIMYKFKYFRCYIRLGMLLSSNLAFSFHFHAIMQMTLIKIHWHVKHDERREASQSQTLDFT